jgi:hypothetical protein
MPVLVLHEVDIYISFIWKLFSPTGKCEPAFQIQPIFKAPIISCFLHVSHVILEIPNSTG